MKVYIVGSGVGGMSCTAILGYNGFDITIIE